MDIEAFQANEITGVTVMDDGQHIVLHLKDGAGQPFNVAFPAGQMMNLMTMASQGATQAEKILRSDKSVKHILPCEWWEFGLDSNQNEDRKLIVSFRVSGGIELSFRIHQDQIPNMIQALRTAGGEPIPAPPGTIIQ